MAITAVLAALATASTFAYAPPSARQVPFNPGPTIILEHTLRVAENPEVTRLKNAFSDLTEQFNKPGLTESERQAIARQIIERTNHINSGNGGKPADTTAPFMGKHP